MEAPARTPLISLTSELEPTLLVVGDGFDDRDELVQALGSQGVYVELSSVADAHQAVVTVAPDLVVLVGDAASDRLTAVLADLGSSPMSSVVPVAVVSEDDELPARLAAFRHGAAAAVSFANGAQKAASELSLLAKAIPERSGESVGTLGEATLPELISALSEEVRSGILSVYGPADPGKVLRLALGGGKPLAAAVSDFVDRVNALVLSSEPVQFEFDERAGGTVSVLEPRPPMPSLSVNDITGVRIMIAGQDPASADALAQTLRAQGAEIQLTGFLPDAARMDRLERFDPMMVVIGEADLSGAGYDLVSQLRSDHRLRWAALLVVRWGEIWPDETEPARLEGLLGSIAALAEPDRSATQRAKSGAVFDVRLESVGGARLLRALASVESPLKVELANPRARINLVLHAGDLVRCEGVSAGDPEPLQLEGTSALSAMLVLRSGRVRISPIEVADGTPHLGQIADILEHLQGEPPIAPSLFPVALSDVVPQSLRPPPHPPDEHAATGSTSVEPDLTAEPVAGRRVPAWALVVSVVGVLLLGAAIVFYLSSTPKTAAQQATSSGVPSGTPSASESGPTAMTQPESVIERARRGDPAALKELESLSPEERTTEQALALSQGWLAKKRADLDALGKKLAQDPALMEQRPVQRQLLESARDATLAQQTLQLMAKQESPIAVDLLYEVWTGTRGRTEATRLAEALVYTADVRKRASPALAALLDLRTETDCEKMRELLARVQEHGDRRSLRPLGKLTLRRGCGPSKAEDCFPCLREGEELRKTIDAVKSRPGPGF